MNDKLDISREGNFDFEDFTSNEAVKIKQLKDILMKYWGCMVYSRIETSRPERIDFNKITSINTQTIDNNFAEGYPKQLTITFAKDILKYKHSGVKKWYSGQAGGRKWKAALVESKVMKQQPFSPAPFNAVIIYDSEDIQPLLTPKRIPAILDKLAADLPTIQAKKPPEAAEAKANDETSFKFDLQPLKGMLIPRFTDNEKLAFDWGQRHESGLQSYENPFVSERLHNSKIDIYYAGEKVDLPIGEKIGYPQTKDDLQKFLMVAFGDKAYALLLGLSYFHHRTNRGRFEVNINKLAKLLFGAYNSKIKKELVDAIDALQYLSIRLKQPHNGGEIEHVYTPLIISEIHRTKAGKLPTTIKLQLWPQDESKNFSNDVVPFEIFSLRQNEFAFACYVLLKQAQSGGHPTFKIEIDKAMKTAGLSMNEKNFRMSRKRLKEKIARLKAAGISGSFVGESGGFITIQALRKTKPIKAPEGTKGKKRINTRKKE